MDLAWINPAGWHPDARADHARRSPSGSSSSADRCLRGSARKLASLRMLLIAEVWWVRPLRSTTGTLLQLAYVENHGPNLLLCQNTLGARHTGRPKAVIDNPFQ